MERSSYGTKYPIVLVHGIAAKKLRILNAFGKIGNKLEEAGNAVFSADTDGFGRIENNAEQLRDYIERVLSETGAEKVNIIAAQRAVHIIKGVVPSLYLITRQRASSCGLMIYNTSRW